MKNFLVSRAIIYKQRYWLMRQETWWCRKGRFCLTLLMLLTCKSGVGKDQVLSHVFAGNTNIEAIGFPGRKRRLLCFHEEVKKVRLNSQ